MGMWTWTPVAVRRTILGMAKAVGIFTTVGNSRWRNQRLLILGYHGISIDDEHLWNKTLFMPQCLFRERMDVLRREGCTVLPLEEAIQRLYSGELPHKSVALTFDDGMQDFTLRALPVLEEFGYPAAVYLTTYYSINRHPVFNVFYPYLLWKCEQAGTDPLPVVAKALGVPVPREAGVAGCAEILRKWLQSEHPDHERRHQVARLLATSAGLDYDKLLASGVFQLMAPKEISGNLTRRGVRVELHTHRHRVPTDEDLFKKEIRENRACIKAIVPEGPEPTHFCYPGGNYSPKLLPWLEDEQIQSATTCRTGLAQKSSHRLRLPRLIDTCCISPLDFEGWVSGVSHLLPRRS
jgi:peptidoglycan/xylan/chitin deacetylase (PgdA/CDA1 family)